MKLFQSYGLQPEEGEQQIRAGQPSPPRRASSRARPPQPQKYRWFDQWLRAKEHGGSRRLVERTIGLLEHIETHTKARKRTRRATDLAAQHLRIEAIVCNLAYAVLEPPPTGKIATKLGNGTKGRTRYESEVLGKMMRPTVLMLEGLDILVLTHAEAIRGEVSSIAPTPWFRRKVKEFGVTKEDFTRDAVEEVIVLTRAVKEATDWASGSKPRKFREPIDYIETDETRKLRDGMHRLNGFLAGLTSPSSMTDLSLGSSSLRQDLKAALCDPRRPA